jgi:hypothetical protein
MRGRLGVAFLLFAFGWGGVGLLFFWLFGRFYFYWSISVAPMRGTGGKLIDQ